MKNKKISGAEAVVHSLLNEGVDLIWGYPGGAIMPVYDEFYKFQDKLQHILARHEQGAIHAAQGYARSSGKVGVAIATSGPGATNLVTGIADAQIDSTPIVCITGQVPSHLLGSDAFQETDIIGISMPVTKWNYQITKASEIPEIFAKAFYIAKSGRPGPVLIDITKDAQFELFDFKYSKCKGIRSYNPLPTISDDSIDNAAKLINNAKKPLIVWGQGVILGNAEKEFKDFVEKSGIPAAWTILGLSALPTSHNLNVGMVGMHGNYGPNILTNKCDLLIAIGMRFDDRVTGDPKTYASQAKIIHLDIDPAEINKNIHVDVALIGNAKDILKQMLPKLKKKTHIDWLNHIAKLKEDHPSLKLKKSIDLTGQYVVKSLSDETDGKSVIVTGVGQHQMWAAQHYLYCSQNSWISSGGLGTMGFEVPAALGAKVGAPEKNVWSIAGDGGFQMTLCELATIVENNIKVKFALLNNNHLGMITQWQGMFFNEDYQANAYTANPDFVKLANAYGMKALSVDNNEDVRPAIREANDHDGPFLIDFKIKKEENVFPMIPSGQSVNELLEEPVDGGN